MIFDRGIAKAAGISRAVSGRLLTLDNPAGWMTGEDSGMSADRAMKVSTVNRCVEVRSNTIAVLPVYILNERTKERLSDHRLGRVLWGRANEAMTSFDYEKLMQVNRDMRGNAYAWIYRDSSSGYPLELIPLPPDCVTPHVDDGGRLWYIYFDPGTGGMTKLPLEDVLHYKAYSTDGIKGISVLHRASRIVRTALSAQQYEQDMYNNGGRPSGVLTTEESLGNSVTTTDADGNEITFNPKDMLRDEWDRMQSGAGKRFRIAVLDHGLKYQPISMNNSDAQFVQSSEIRVADICRYFGVPLHLVYAGKQSYNSNEQNALDYVKYSLQADVTQREQEDTYKLLLPRERTEWIRIRREMKTFLRGDTAAQAAWYKAMREISVYSADDILELEDRAPVPGGESRYASWNYGPLSRWEELSVVRAMSKGQQPIREE